MIVIVIRSQKIYRSYSHSYRISLARGIHYIESNFITVTAHAYTHNYLIMRRRLVRCCCYDDTKWNEKANTWKPKTKRQKYEKPLEK